MVALVRTGVPYETAAKWSAVRRRAWLIAAGEMAGASFDWGRMEWQDPK